MNEYDFTPIGKAIKRERKKAGLTRERLSEIVNISPRYLISIENDGQTPSFPILLILVRTFNISIDQYIYDDSVKITSTTRRNVYNLLEEIDDCDLLIVEHTLRGILERNNHLR